MTNKAIILVVKLQRETHLSIREAESFVKAIPLSHLDTAVEIYNKYNFLELKTYVESIVNMQSAFLKL